MIRVFLGKPPRPNLAYQALQKRVYKGFLDFFRLFRLFLTTLAPLAKTREPCRALLLEISIS